MRSLNPLPLISAFFLVLQASNNVFAASRALRARDAFTTFSDNSINEGENHDPLKAPDGSEIRSISIGTTGTTVPAYWSTGVENQMQEATQAFIVIHGKLRDGDNYWSIMQQALESAVQDNYPGVDSKAVVVAPQFFSERFNSGEYSNTDLAFLDVNAWQAGDVAVHPQGTKVTSMDAIDSLIQTFADKNQYPSMKSVIVVGHGGGGQLIARYAAVGIDPPDGISLRYIVGDPSTNAYFTTHRPVATTENNFNSSCDFSNVWRYGFDNFTGTTQLSAQEPFVYFQKYINRDIVFLIANDDTDVNGDQYCPALVQGGTARRDRNLAWWAYINTLARTPEPVQLLSNLVPEFAKNKNLPNWSNATRSSSFIGPKLIVVENAGHDPAQVLGGSEGRAALWNAMSDMPQGWRPDGWNDTTSDCGFCDGDQERRTQMSDMNSNTTTAGDNSSSGSASGSGGDNNGALGHGLKGALEVMLVVLACVALI
ncbi:hypothetical protein D9758_010169 [Tetrapyrgos nigripes]|uniref:AB hydrolase-1 domain-containing protein n=1 Tax=Tetrapyrgos nigripes TaxID=182062 RepID=A0A8H5CZ57_9AGAR|nr:hypothetical protein D9758_010169 [Tetrapyrgos nigripes]